MDSLDPVLDVMEEWGRSLDWVPVTIGLVAVFVGFVLTAFAGTILIAALVVSLRTRRLFKRANRSMADTIELMEYPPGFDSTTDASSDYDTAIPLDRHSQ